MKKSIVDIISMEEAKLAMDSQDEQDKNSVALFGLQNETSQKDTKRVFEAKN